MKVKSKIKAGQSHGDDSRTRETKPSMTSSPQIRRR